MNPQCITGPSCGKIPTSKRELHARLVAQCIAPLFGASQRIVEGNRPDIPVERATRIAGVRVEIGLELHIVGFFRAELVRTCQLQRAVEGRERALRFAEGIVGGGRLGEEIRLVDQIAGGAGQAAGGFEGGDA